MSNYKFHDHNYTANNSVSEIGNGPERAKFPTDLSESVTVTELEEHSGSIEIPLSAVGASVPETATCNVTIVPAGLEIARRDDRYLVERDGAGWSLTGVVGRNELPTRVPDWLGAVAELFGCEEVQLGR